MRRSLRRALGATLVLLSAFVGSQRASVQGPEHGGQPRPSRESAAALVIERATRTASDARAEPEEQRATELVLVAGGDVSFGRRTGQRLLRDAAFDPFRGVAALLATGDFRFVNLESTLSDQNGETEHPTRRLTFTGPPSGAPALARAGIELVSVANNHAWDYGVDAYFETLAHLERANVAYVGGSREPAPTIAPRTLRVHGWSMAWFAATDIWNTGPQTALAAALHVTFARLDAVAAAVASARAQHDLVLVSYHGGAEYSEHIAREQRAFAKAVMAAGADAVIGHHPHVPQGVEWFEGRPVLYSLGNLVFNHHRDHAWTGRGFLARLRFTKGSAPRVELCPYHITDGGPVGIATGDRGTIALFRSHLKRIAAYAGFSQVGEPGDDGCMPVAPRALALAAQLEHRGGTHAE